MNRKKIYIYFGMAAFLITLMSGRAHSVEKEVPWKTLLVFYHDAGAAPAGTYESFLSEVRSAVQKEDCFDIHEETVPQRILEKSDSSDLLEYAAKKGYEKIILVRMIVTTDKVQEAEGSTGPDQYLIRKKIISYSIDAKIYLVEGEKETPVYQITKIRQNALTKATHDLVNALHQKAGKKKKIIIPDPVAPPKPVVPPQPAWNIYRMYFGIAGEGIAPLQLYSRYALYGGGVAFSGGFENPYLRNNYFLCGISAAEVQAKMSSMSHYEIVSFDVGAGYRFGMKSINLMPSLSAGYLSHIVSSGIYYDPLVRVALKASYPVFETHEFFAELSYVSFFENHHVGEMICCSIGYQWNFEIKVLKDERGSHN